MSDSKIIEPTKVQIRVLGRDPEGRPTIGFSVYEVPFDDDTPDYDADVLASTDEADKYLTGHRARYERPPSLGYTSIEVLQMLWGRPWDQYALNMMAAVRPSCIRVVVPGEGLTCDAVTWRVTVYLGEDERTIGQITQEVEVGTVGASHGHGLHKYSVGADPTPQHLFVNTRGLKKLNLDRGDG